VEDAAESVMSTHLQVSDSRPPQRQMVRNGVAADSGRPAEVMAQSPAGAGAGVSGQLDRAAAEFRGERAAGCPDRPTRRATVATAAATERMLGRLPDWRPAAADVRE
jgi:hypothetical protein